MEPAAESAGEPIQMEATKDLPTKPEPPVFESAAPEPPELEFVALELMEAILANFFLESELLILEPIIQSGSC